MTAQSETAVCDRPRGLSTEQCTALLERMACVLDQQARQQRTLSYLQLADAIAMPGPERIHRTTRLLELLMQRDALAERPIRAALAVSRVGNGLPARGFFACARRLDLFDGQDEAGFHRALLQALFGSAGAASA